ncbi:hypothetical protein [Flavobacterium limnophilum]|uniref:hypothetical protein n=1 Tax=Flavobacterium limnophilum TaxID=3003262 RepID=UPI002482AE5A|nr:hypothetical protein [Flavobacterium limnophilum]
MKILKTILILLSVFLFTSCRNTGGKQDIETSNVDTLRTTKTHVNPQFDENIISKIKKHYHNKYGGKGEFNEQNTDSTYELSYRYDGTDYDNDFFHDMIYIAKNDSCKDFFALNPIIYGDLNNDMSQDLVVTVHIEGGGNANWDNEIFVFLNENDKLIFTNVTSSRDLADCEGTFLPKKIESGYLIGNSSCFGSDDNLWSPSINYITKVKLESHKLVFKSKVKAK